jgi:hypothetical protein
VRRNRDRRDCEPATKQRQALRIVLSFQLSFISLLVERSIIIIICRPIAPADSVERRRGVGLLGHLGFWKVWCGVPDRETQSTTEETRVFMWIVDDALCGRNTENLGRTLYSTVETVRFREKMPTVRDAIPVRPSSPSSFKTPLCCPALPYDYHGPAGKALNPYSSCHSNTFFEVLHSVQTRCDSDVFETSRLRLADKIP